MCTDDFIEGVYWQPRERALAGYKYIEANPRNVSGLLVADIDDSSARAMALWRHTHMLPNVLVENPVNGNAHVVWAYRFGTTGTTAMDCARPSQTAPSR